MNYAIGAVTPTVRVGVPFDIPLQIKDAYDNLTTLPPEIQPELKCRCVSLVLLNV